MDQLIASTAKSRVTIVVPNYNHARYLPESLGSIAAQTRAPIAYSSSMMRRPMTASP